MDAELTTRLLTTLVQVLQKRFTELPRTSKGAFVTFLREDKKLQFREIADVIGYSISYTQQLRGDPDGSKNKARKKSYGRKCIDCGRTTDGSYGREKAPLRCVMCQRKYAAKDLPYRLSRVSTYQKWSDEECLNALRRAVAINGAGVGTKSYNELRRPEDPDAQTLMVRWDTWWSACEAAGVPTSHSRRRTYARIPAEECHAAFNLVADELGHPPTLSEYREYSKQHRELKLPSTSIISRRYGSWISLIQDWVDQHEKV